MTAALVTSSVADHVATVTLDRPQKLNAFADDMRDQLLAAIDRVAADPSARVLVITGAGRAFCAGGDVGYMATLKQRDASFDDLPPAARHRRRDRLAARRAADPDDRGGERRRPRARGSTWRWPATCASPPTRRRSARRS